MTSSCTESKIDSMVLCILSQFYSNIYDIVICVFLYCGQNTFFSKLASYIICILYSSFFCFWLPKNKNIENLLGFLTIFFAPFWADSKDVPIVTQGYYVFLSEGFHSVCRSTSEHFKSYTVTFTMLYKILLPRICLLYRSLCSCFVHNVIY